MIATDHMTNPEFPQQSSSRRPNAVENQLFTLRSSIEQLRKAYNGHDVEWSDNGKFSKNLACFVLSPFWFDRIDWLIFYSIFCISFLQKSHTTAVVLVPVMVQMGKSKKALASHQSISHQKQKKRTARRQRTQSPPVKPAIPAPVAVPAQKPTPTSNHTTSIPIAITSTKIALVVIIITIIIRAVLLAQHHRKCHYDEL